MAEIVRFAIHGHLGHASGPGRCGICETEQVPLKGDVEMRSEDFISRLGSLEVCGACLETLAGLTRLEAARGKLLKLDLMR